MEIRTPVLTLKGSRPGPLDDGGLKIERAEYIIAKKRGQASVARGSPRDPHPGPGIVGTCSSRRGCCQVPLGRSPDWRVARALRRRGVGLPAVGSKSIANQDTAFSSYSRFPQTSQIHAGKFGTVINSSPSHVKYVISRGCIMPAGQCSQGIGWGASSGRFTGGRSAGFGQGRYRAQ